MKRLGTLLLVLSLTLGLAACGGTASSPSLSAAPTPAAPAQSQPAEAVELIVFAAASMTETLNQIAALYADVAPNVKLPFNFAPPGPLKPQIRGGGRLRPLPLRRTEADEPA